MPKIPTVQGKYYALTKMRYQNKKNRLRPGLTLVEMVLAVAIITIIFTAMVPLFRQIQNGWDSKQGATEAIQNGRVLIEHINRNLSKAVKITAVSDSTDPNGYIEFEDNDGNTLRYDIASSYVEYGPVGSLSDLAGPVSQLQFTCYSDSDLDTPITEVNDIRSVNVQAILTNSSARGQDKTFTAQPYLRTNGTSDANQSGITGETPFEYDGVDGYTPVLAKIDSTHYLCAYKGPGEKKANNGWVTVLKVNTGTWAITNETPFEYDTAFGGDATLAKIDDNHYLCVYRGDQNHGRAVVLTVDTGNWTISKGTVFEYDVLYGITPALAQIDSTHYLCTYIGEFNVAYAVVLTVDTGNWTISKGTTFEYGTTGEIPALAKIDDNHYLCASHEESTGHGWAVVLIVDTGDWTISKGTAFEYDALGGITPALAQINSTHYLCAYTGSTIKGWAVVLIVDTGDWTISKGTALEYAPIPEQTTGETPALSQIDSTNYLCAYEGPNRDGWAVILTVDTGNWTISSGTAFEYDTDEGQYPALAQIDSSHYLCAYEGPAGGSANDGWAIVLTVSSGSGSEIRP